MSLRAWAPSEDAGCVLTGGPLPPSVALMEARSALTLRERRGKRNVAKTSEGNPAPSSKQASVHRRPNLSCGLSPWS